MASPERARPACWFPIKGFTQSRRAARNRIHAEARSRGGKREKEFERALRARFKETENSIYLEKKILYASAALRENFSPRLRASA